jgi:hypothetical protein
MSLSFIFLVPMALGFLVVWFSETQKSLGAPRLPALARRPRLHGGGDRFPPRGFICVILWLPLVWFMSSLGGVLAGVLRDARVGQVQALCVAAVALLPFVAGPLESLRERETEIRTAHTSIGDRGLADAGLAAASARCRASPKPNMVRRGAIGWASRVQPRPCSKAPASAPSATPVSRAMCSSSRR